jgi:Vacuolar protein sorting-associated protein 26
MSSFFFSTPVDIDIVLEDADERQTVDVKLDKNRREKAPLYMDGESVKGAVTIRTKDGRRLEHTGIKVQFIGLIGMAIKYLLCNDIMLTMLLQRCSTTEAITTNSCRSGKS